MQNFSDMMGDLPVDVADWHLTGSYILAREQWDKKPTDIDVVLFVPDLDLQSIWEAFETASRGGDYYDTTNEPGQYGEGQICFRKGIYNLIVCNTKSRYNAWKAATDVAAYAKLWDCDMTEKDNRVALFKAVRESMGEL